MQAPETGHNDGQNGQQGDAFCKAPHRKTYLFAVDSLFFHFSQSPNGLMPNRNSPGLLATFTEI